MDQLQTRLDALEQQMHTVTRRLRWWRGLAGGYSCWRCSPGRCRQARRRKGPPDGDNKGLAQRVAALEDLLKHFSREGNEVFITGANLHIVNGRGQTDCGSAEEPIPGCPNALGNLIVGYNESRTDPDFPDVRTGSHNIVVGARLDFSRFGGVVVGQFNAIHGDFSSVSGGEGNTTSGRGAAVSGGERNEASGDWSSVSGGGFNPRIVEEGAGNTSSGLGSSVSGGQGNTASGLFSSVSGGFNRTAAGEFDWVAGSLFEDE